MIEIEQKMCHGCGLCARICHEQCITIGGRNGHKFAQVNHALCSTCTQCIAICPRQALSWNRAIPLAYDKTMLPTASQLEELFKQRRTVRKFKQKKIDRSLVEKIAALGIYAPTNNYELRAIIIDDHAVMETLGDIIMKFVAVFYKLVYKSKIIFSLLNAITTAVDPKNKVKLERGLEMGRAFETMPAAIISIVGDRRILLSEASAQYALYNMILYALSLGIGSRIKAAGPITLDKNKAARKILGLQKHEHILATLELGYPAVRFRNKVEGKSMGVTWIGGESNV